MIKIPSKQTLKRYGLDSQQWESILHSQGNKCPICEREFNEIVKPCTDHFHLKGYKNKSPEIRRRQVRGILCLYCNRMLIPKGMTTRRAKNVWKYLEAFDNKTIL